jgi:ferredoxin-NADP reductase/nitrite reductase/ring-hydroxylating ferredoxin subunit
MASFQRCDEENEMYVDFRQWYPIASSSDLPLRHVYQGQLWGRELAVWRADDGHVNVWENRCLHRGVRLSIGLNEGRELRCLYHGWRYANRTAGCTYIPAHPADAPARTICNNTYQCIEAHGLVWSAIAPESDLTLPVALDNTMPLALRPIPISAPSSEVKKIARDYPFGALIDQDDKCLTFQSSDARLHLFIQPVDAGRTILRGLLSPTPTDPIEAMQHHNDAMTALRDRIELAVAGAPPPAAIDVQFAPVAKELAEMPDRAPAGPKVELRTKVVRKWQVANQVIAYRLESIGGQLPTAHPGSHIDVSLPNGMSRQYSLTNGPGETDHYTIGVKRDSASRGGSICLQDDVQEGDVLAISAPHNNFPLRRDAVKTILIAGGIGLTPMLAMAQALKVQDLPFELHVFVRLKNDLAFPNLLDELGESVVPYIGLSSEVTGGAIADIVGNYTPGQHVYLCGPGSMLEAARGMAANAGWPDSAVHFEYFKNTNDIDNSTTFEIALARSALTLQVPAGKTILQVLNENGITAPSSCEQGACGTCLMTVIDGEPDHKDVYLSSIERASNQKIVTCVSRSKSQRLVLDI